MNVNTASGTLSPTAATTIYTGSSAISNSLTISPSITNSSITTDIGAYNGSSIPDFGVDSVPAGLFVKGNAEIGGTLTVGGVQITKSINERLDAIEKRLNILKFNPELESRWEELRLARERYLELEAEFASYELVIDILKT